jgi:integrase
MTEYVFRPARRGVRSRVWHGRYNLGRGQPVRTASLDTPDKTVARQRLRALVVEKQQEAAGIIAPASRRAAAAATLQSLLNDYITDIAVRKCSAKHERDSRYRIRAILAGTGWKRLADIRADEFLRFRAGLALSPKTVNEYQFALQAFLNWLVGIDALARNPLANIKPVNTKGQPNRAARALTPDELRAVLKASAPYRAAVYHFLAYTGLRRGEAKGLHWADIHGMETPRPFIRLDEERTKDRTKRVIPLHRDLAAMPAGAPGPKTGPLFRKFPKLDSLWADLAAAGIARADERGRRVHFHSFRKTFQTMGVMAGINQRAAQELLGHNSSLQSNWLSI